MGLKETALAVLLGDETLTLSDRLYPGGPLGSEYGVDPGIMTPAVASAPVEEARPGPEAPAARGATTLSFGAVGTAIFGGFVRDLGEYNPKLDGRTAFMTYEKMRRSDADVAAALQACKLPIRAADWQIVPGCEEGDPGYARAKEIAEFVEGNLFGGLESEGRTGVKVSQSWESILENALLMQEFGCAGHEDLWTVDGDHIRLRRLAPRLPITFYRFHVDADGETLLAVEQYGYRGNNFVNALVPAEKFSLFNINQEGANFFGRSLLRPAYQHWYIKSQLYRIDAIGIERNALGIPTMKMGPNYSEQDRKKADAWVRNLATHEQVGLTLPPEWDFLVKAVEGRVRDPMNSIRHHSEMIVRSVLAMFLALGTTQTGSRALGSEMLDFFYLSLEATARRIAAVMNETTIRRLVDYNFSSANGDPVAYPRLVPQNIAVLNVVDLLTVLKDVATSGVDLIQPDDETENYVRRKVGLPLKGKQARPRYAPVVQRIQEEPAPGETPEEIETGKGKIEPAQKKEFRASEAIPTYPLNRPLKDFEKKHDFQAHGARQDKTSRQVSRLLRKAKPALIRHAARIAAVTPVQQLQSVQVPFDHELAARLATVLEVAHRFAHEQVYAERRKATGRGRQEPAKQLLADPARRAGRAARSKDSPQFIAEATVSDLSNAISARAIARAVDLAKQGLDQDELEAGIIEGLTEASDGFIDRIGFEAGRSAVVGGRADGLGELAGEIARYVRVEAMDQNTCEPCQGGDGTEWESEDEIDWSPGDDCDGGDACRGQIMPIFADEGKVIIE